MKTREKIQIGVAFGMLFVCFTIFLWNAILCEVLPWSRTWFPDHQSFCELLAENRCMRTSCFMQELPSNSGETEYYWHRSWSKKLAAYSVVLAEAEYMKIAESRMVSYYEYGNGKLECPLYIQQQGSELCCFEDMDFFAEDLSFVKKVMQSPEAQQQYYFLLVAQHGTATDTICYTGVVLNDTTKELIEFSLEYAKGAPISEENAEKKEARRREDAILTVIVFASAFLLVYVMKVIDKKLTRKGN